MEEIFDKSILILVKCPKSKTHVELDVCLGCSYYRGNKRDTEPELFKTYVIAYIIGLKIEVECNFQE